MAAKKGRGPTPGGEISRETVTRAAGERSAGASSLHTFGYRELAEFLATPVKPIVAAVVDGYLDPVSLLELAVAKKHGIEWMARQKDEHTAAWRAIRQARPKATREVCSIKLPPLPPLYGLDTLWGYGYSDLAAQTHPSAPMSDLEWQRRVWNEGKPDRAGFQIDDLSSVVTWVGRHQRPVVLRDLQLTE
jgi:hypothetical protein